MKSYAVDLGHILFGDVLAVSPADLILTAVLGLLVLFTIVILYKPFVVISFDPVLAATMRLPADSLRMLMLVLLALTVVVSLQTVGVGLAAAMLVTPAATAYLLTRRLLPMMLLAAVLGALSSVVGLYVSYYLNVVSGAAIVLSATLFFLLAWLFNSRTGVLVRTRPTLTPCISITPRLRWIRSHRLPYRSSNTATVP